MDASISVTFPVPAYQLWSTSRSSRAISQMEAIADGPCLPALRSLYLGACVLERHWEASYWWKGGLGRGFVRSPTLASSFELHHPGGYTRHDAGAGRFVLLLNHPPTVTLNHVSGFRDALLVRKTGMFDISRWRMAHGVYFS